MLNRIDELLNDQQDFAFETTRSSKTYLHYLKRSKEKGYEMTLLLLWLNSIELAIERVRIRVIEGGHDIPEEIIKRRYKRGLENFFNLYKKEVDNWMFIDNSGNEYKELAQGTNGEENIYEQGTWFNLKQKYAK